MAQPVSPLLHVMIAAAQKAGRALIRDFGEIEHLQVSKKGPADFVSHADTKAEQIVVEELSKARPDYGFLLEEGGAIEGKDTSNRWLVDPLDGTTNFLHGIPHFAVSVALERDRRLEAGVVYEPVGDLEAALLSVSHATAAILPAYHGSSRHVVRYHLFVDHERQKTYEYRIRTVQAAWAGVLPFSWMRALLPSLEEAFRATAYQFFVDAALDGYLRPS